MDCSTTIIVLNSKLSESYMNNKTIRILKETALQYETKDFLLKDPALFMHIPKEKHDKEVMAFIASCMSYGRRELFFPKIQYILDCSKTKLVQWILSGNYEHDIPDNEQSFYRLYTNHIMNRFLYRLKQLLITYGSLEKFAAYHAPDHKAITLIKAFCSYFNEVGQTHIIPQNTQSSCKRLCMFLRWMVRKDSPVDLGLWNDIIDQRTLIMPLDTHVIQEANRLGLIKTKSTSMKVACELTEKLCKIFPEDPLKGDFALFGYGINN